MKREIKFMVYSNKNLPRERFFKVLLTKDCIVFMFRMFDVSLWWGGGYQDNGY